MIIIKNSSQIIKMRESNRIVAEFLNMIESNIKPGVTTFEISMIAQDFLKSQGAIPSFKNYTIPGLPPFPGVICTSVNAGIVHGIPNKNTVLKDGDIIGIDIGAYKNGYHGDSARTYCVGKKTEAIQELFDVTQSALQVGIEAAVEGNRVGHIAKAIGSFVKNKGFFISDELAGHGIGKDLHEEPIVPNETKFIRGPKLRAGMTIAIEPMVNVGTHKVKQNGWEYFTKDNSLSAHFEHTILITKNEPEILSVVR